MPRKRILSHKRLRPTLDAFLPPPEPEPETESRWPGVRQALEKIAEQNRELLAGATPGTKRYRILERLQRQAETALKRHSNDRSQQ